jgi:beta-carotene 15,15'-dioxygenase
MSTGRTGARVGSPSGAVLAPGPEAAPPVRRRGAHATTAVSLAAAALAVALGTILHDDGSASGASSVPLVVAAVGIVAGIPHGAVDHLVALRLADDGNGVTRTRMRRLGVILVGYLAIAALAATAFLVAPDVSFAVFLVLAALHFGWGELTFAAERAERPLPTLREGAAGAVVLGLVVIGLPLATPAGREAVSLLAPRLVAGLDRVLAGLPGPVVAIGGVSLPVTVLLVVAGLATALAVRRLREHRDLEAAEIVVLVVLFGTTPPLVAFGVYFGAWHALRHTRRLLDVIAPGAPRTVQAAAFLRAAALPTAGALGTLVVLWAWRGNQDVLVVGIAVLLALTFPHAAVVSALDRPLSPRAPGRRRSRA